MSEELEVKLRKEPRISMNKLAEFAVTSDSTRRHRIIADQIVERPYKRITYDPARRDLARFFTNPSAPTEQLRRMAEALRDRAAAVPDEDRTTRTSLICSARALDSFELIANEVRRTKAVATPAGAGKSELVWSDVHVSIRPDLWFVGPGTERHVGAVTFHFSAEGRLSPQGLKYAATLLRQYLITQGESPQPSLCLAIDVMAGEHETAPRGMVNLVRRLQGCCKEIAMLWPGLFAEELEKEKRKNKVRII